MCRDVQRCAEMCRDVQRCAEMCRDVQYRHFITRELDAQERELQPWAAPGDDDTLEEPEDEPCLQLPATACNSYELCEPKFRC